MLLHMLLDMQMHMQMDMLLYGDLHKKHPEKCLRNTPEKALFFMPACKQNSPVQFSFPTEKILFL